METTTMNYSYFESLFIKLQDEGQTLDDRLNALTEIVLIQSATIDALQIKLNKIGGIVEDEEY
jgi:hypothetical protein